MTIANRLYAGFAFIILLLVATTVIGTYQVDEINKTLTRVNEVGSEKQRYAINYRGSVHDRYECANRHRGGRTKLGSG